MRNMRLRVNHLESAVGVDVAVPFFGGSPNVPMQLNLNSRRIFIDPEQQGQVFYVQNGQRIRTNAPAALQYLEWQDIDRTVIPAAVQRMRAVMDLRSRGLEHNLGSIGMTISVWDRVSDIDPADVSMSAATAGQKDLPAYQTASVPVPVIHKSFSIELRRLMASRTFGEALDTTTSDLAARRVGEKMEEILLIGNNLIQVTDPSIGTALIYGYTNHPDRNLVDMQTHWTALNGAAGENVNIVNDVMDMQQASRNARYYGPWILYVPNEYEAKLDEDYRDSTAGDTRTVRERIMALSGIEDVVVADFLPNHNVILVQLTRDVVDIAMAQDVTPVQWTVTGGMVEEFKVMMVGVPRLKSDYDGRSGITHLFPTS
jgi:hypothetical protein